MSWGYLAQKIKKFIKTFLTKKSKSQRKCLKSFNKELGLPLNTKKSGSPLIYPDLKQAWFDRFEEQRQEEFFGEENYHYLFPEKYPSNFYKKYCFSKGKDLDADKCSLEQYAAFSLSYRKSDGSAVAFQNICEELTKSSLSRATKIIIMQCVVENYEQYANAGFPKLNYENLNLFFPKPEDPLDKTKLLELQEWAAENTKLNAKNTFGTS